MLARRVEHSLTGSTLFPFQAEPTHKNPTFGGAKNGVPGDQPVMAFTTPFRISRVLPEDAASRARPIDAFNFRLWAIPIVASAYTERLSAGQKRRFSNNKIVKRTNTMETAPSNAFIQGIKVNSLL